MRPRRSLCRFLLLLLLALPPVSRAADLTVENPRAGEPRIEIFTTSWCPYCKKAIDFFRERGLDVVEYDIERNPKAAQLKEKLDRRPGVPFVLIDRRIGIHGYTPEGYAKALEILRDGKASQEGRRQGI